MPCSSLTRQGNQGKTPPIACRAACTSNCQWLQVSRLPVVLSVHQIVIREWSWDFFDSLWLHQLPTWTYLLFQSIFVWQKMKKIYFLVYLLVSYGNMHHLLYLVTHLHSFLLKKDCLRVRSFFSEFPFCTTKHICTERSEQAVSSLVVGNNKIFWEAFLSWQHTRCNQFWMLK